MSNIDLYLTNNILAYLTPPYHHRTNSNHITDKHQKFHFFGFIFTISPEFNLKMLFLSHSICHHWEGVRNKGDDGVKLCCIAIQKQSNTKKYSADSFIGLKLSHGMK